MSNTRAVLGTLVLAVVLSAGAAEGKSKGKGKRARGKAKAVVEAPVEQPKSDLEAALEAVTALETDIAGLGKRIRATHGEERDSLAANLETRKNELIDSIEQLGGELTEAVGDAEAPLEPDLVAAARGKVDGLGRTLAGAIDELEEAQSAARSEIEKAAPEDAAELASGVAERAKALDDTYRGYARHLEQRKALGLEFEGVEKDLLAKLERRAEALTGRLTRLAGALATAKEQASAAPDDAALAGAVQVLQTRLDAAAASLGLSADILADLEVDVTKYRQELVRATGGLSADVLDKDVALGLAEGWLNDAKTWLFERGPGVLFDVVVFILIIWVFRLLSKLTRRLLAGALKSTQLPQLAHEIVVSTASRLVLAFGVLVALSQIGVALGPLLAGLGVAGFIVGFALQETLGNFAAGTMILVYRPFDVGDLIEAGGVFGTVRQMGLVSTTILTVDNQRMIVPNNKIWGDVIRNVSAEPVRRVDMVFGISYADDVDRARKLLEETLEDHEKVLGDPKPVVRLHTLGESSVDFVARPWVKTSDYWEVYWDITRQVKVRFDAEGISIPFPQRDIHVHQVDASAARAVVSGVAPVSATASGQGPEDDD